MKKKLISYLGDLGVWLADRCYPRRSTSVEVACNKQYVQLMIDSLRGTIPHYGRDREKDSIPMVAERRDYAAPQWASVEARKRADEAIKGIVGEVL